MSYNQSIVNPGAKATCHPDSPPHCLLVQLQSKLRLTVLLILNPCRAHSRGRPSRPLATARRPELGSRVDHYPDADQGFHNAATLSAACCAPALPCPPLQTG